MSYTYHWDIYMHKTHLYAIRLNQIKYRDVNHNWHYTNNPSRSNIKKQSIHLGIIANLNNFNCQFPEYFL